MQFIAVTYQNKEDLRREIRKLRAKFYSHQQIIDTLHIPERTYYYHWAIIKTENKQVYDKLTEENIREDIERTIAGLEQKIQELQTIIDKNGKVEVKTESVADFERQVAKMEKNILDERIQFDAIRIDGALAIVWAPYQFYYKGKFSHCGIDSFQLIRINGKWKIQYLIDTRRKEDCK